MASERLMRFTKLLKEIFELDKSDLDFGIYRVMNLRKTQIEEFLTQRLPQMVQETLAPFAQGSREEIRAQMTEIETNAAQFGMEAASLPENNPMGQKYHALQNNWQKVQIFRRWRQMCILRYTPSSTVTMRTAISFPSADIRKACMLSPMKARK